MAQSRSKDFARGTEIIETRSRQNGDISSMQPDLTISIVSSDNLNQLLPCLNSIYDQTSNSIIEVIVIDNASKEHLSASLEQFFPKVSIHRNRQRLGFSTNNNAAIAQSTGKYLMLLNDDTLILEDAIDKLVQFLDSNPEAGVIGAHLLNPDRSRQSSYAYFPQPIIEAIWPAANWSHFLNGFPEEPFEVDSVCGAAMVVRREIITEVGCLDTTFDPIYSEEIDWCFRIKGAGWKIFTHPSAKIVHYGSQTMDQMPKRKYELLQAHKLRFFRKHNSATAAETYRTLLALSTIIKLLLWSLVSLLNPKYANKRNLHLFVISRIRSL